MIEHLSPLAESLQNVFVDRFAVPNSQNPHLIPFDLVHDTIVSDTKLPIALQRFAKGSPVLVWGLSQSRLDCTGYSPMEILSNARDVFVGDGGVVPKIEGHLASRSFEMRPGLRMCQCLVPVEGLLSIFRQAA